MKRIELWRWRITDPATGRLKPTRYRMAEADALAVDPKAERIAGSVEVREVPEDPEAQSASRVQRGRQ